jgi:hypothetical protein
VTVRNPRRLALVALCLGLLAGRAAVAVPVPDDDGEAPLATHLRLSVGGGFDSNVRLAPLLDQAGVSAQAPRSGTYAALSLFAGVAARLGAATMEVEYGLLQTAYTDHRLDGSSFQMHMGEWAFEIPLASAVRLRLPVQADVSLLGLADGSHPFEWSLGGEPELTIVPARGLKLRAGLGFADHHPLDPGYGFLEGAERHGFVALEVGSTGWTGAVSAKVRAELFGQSREVTVTSGGDCPTCTGAIITPYSWQGSGLAGRLAAPFSWRVRPMLAASIEDRRYEGRTAEATYGDGSSVRAPLEARRDLKLAARVAVAVTVAADWQLVVRYDFVHNGSNLPSGGGDVCAGLPTCLSSSERDHAYLKHAVGLALEADWE